MSVEYFKCPKCKKFTKHIEVGMQGGMNAELRRDKNKNVGLKVLANALGGLCDYSGMTKVAGTLLGKGTYKCCECGMVAMWNKDGTMDSWDYWPD